MINYVIINGVNSNTKNGLMINELPPISKPQMRSNIEEIDGRDGDIITKLGYSAYDKTITIGLWGTSYDVNDIIAFFNKEGTITFSNEPDKYYKFTMLEQIDIERLLKFKTASITFHCQPFKYPTEETPIEIEYEYVEQDNVESANMTNTEGDTFLKIDLKGNTSQYTTTGKNKLETSLAIMKASNNAGTWNNNVYTFRSVTFTVNDDLSIKINGTATGGRADFYVYGGSSDTGNYMYIQQGTYTFDRANLVDGTLFYAFREKTAGTKYETNTADSAVVLMGTQDCYFYGVMIGLETGKTANNLTLYPMLVSGSTLGEYEPYTNGASPNPDYPQPINVVSGDNELIVNNKNLFNKATITENKYIDASGNLVSDNSNFVGDYIAIDSSKSYYLSASSSQPKRIGYYDSSKTFISRQLLSSGTGVALVIPSNAKYVRISNYNQDLDTTQLEVGSSATTYEPYNGDTYELDLGVENLLPYTNQDFTLNGVRYYAQNGNLYLNGTSSGETQRTNTNFKDNFSFYLNAGTYTLKQNKLDSGNANYFVKYISKYSDDTSLGFVNNTTTSVTITLTERTQVYLGFYVYQKTFSNETFDLQLEEGTKTNSYSPFGQTPIKMRGIGTYEDYFIRNSGKNLFDKDNATYDNTHYKNDNGELTSSSSGSGYCETYIEVKPNTSYTINGVGIARIYYYDSSKTWISRTDAITLPYTFTTPNNCGYIQFQTSVGSYVASSAQLELGSGATTYEPFGIGKWCKYNAIGKVVLDGSRNWIKSGNTNIDRFVLSGYVDYGDTNCFSNYFDNGVYSDTNYTKNKIFLNTYSGTKRIIINYSTVGTTTLEQFKTWLTTNNTIVYYVLQTPYLSLIEDNNLIEQLDNIQNATSYEGTTNVMQVNNDKAFLMDLKAMKKDTNEVVVNNIGNTYSKPTIALEGTGDINIYLNGTQMLKATLTDKMTIDTTNLEAYNPDTMTLLNRQLVGDISKFKLDSGNNTIKMDGNLTTATITDYIRWL